MKDGKILVVDEATNARELLISMLRRQGYAVWDCSNARRVIERVERLRPDVVLLESMLPGTSGFDLCAEIKANPRLRNVRVLLMATLTRHLSDPADLRRRAEADDVIARPFGLVEILDHVEALLPAPSPSPVALPAF